MKIQKCWVVINIKFVGDKSMDYGVIIEDYSYAIANSETGEYLDEYECETKDITKAHFYDSEEIAEEFRTDIDVAYLYQVVEIKIRYSLLKKSKGNKP
jgi:hypothetical protein